MFIPSLTVTAPAARLQALRRARRARLTACVPYRAVAGWSRVVTAGMLVCGFFPSSWALGENRAVSTESSQSQPPSVATPELLFDFYLPAQPLIDALQSYGLLTHQPALFRSEIVSARRSSAVNGRYSAEAALRLLLAGTGLVAERFSQASLAVTSTFILKPQSEESFPAMRSVNLGNLSGYPGLVQARVWQALCANPLTRPGAYRSLMRFQLDEAGHVRQPRLIGSSGDKVRDSALLGVLLSVRLDGPPPKDMPQPVTMLVLPQDTGVVMRCDQTTGGA